MKVALVLDSGSTALDVVGRLQVLAAGAGVVTVLVARELGSVADDTAHCRLVASAALCDVPDLEVVVVVPGSELSLDPDPKVVDWLRKATPTRLRATSGSTGSSYLAGAGVLRQATTRALSKRTREAGSTGCRRVVQDAGSSPPPVHRRHQHGADAAGFEPRSRHRTGRPARH